jgi:hypothetical protein
MRDIKNKAYFQHVFNQNYKIICFVLQYQILAVMGVDISKEEHLFFFVFCFEFKLNFN